jgi:hypothetical protein
LGALRNRTAGHNFERKVVNDLKAIGYDSAVSSRFESRRLDDSGVDICNTSPFHIQCKNMQGNIDYQKFLEDINPPEGFEMRVLLHKKTKKVKTRFMPEGIFAIMYYEDFLRLAELQKAYDEGKIRKSPGDKHKQAKRPRG